MYPRLLRDGNLPDLSRPYRHAASALLLNCCDHPGPGRGRWIPDACRRIWLNARCGPLEPGPQQWAAYDARGPELQRASPRSARPGFVSGQTDPSETIAELSQLPGALAGCVTAELHRRVVDATASPPRYVYAATAIDMGHHRELIEDAVLGVEEDLDQERP